LSRIKIALEEERKGRVESKKQLEGKKADGLKFLRQRGIEIQNNFPERLNSENPAGPFGVLEMVIYGTLLKEGESPTVKTHEIC